jgi:hypothetical protein
VLDEFGRLHGGHDMPASEQVPCGQSRDQRAVSYSTVKTHIHHLYAKLGTHRRAEAVEHARAVGLLAPSPHQGQATRAG